MNLRQRFLTRGLLPLTAVLFAGSAQAGNLEFKPSITVSEEYTDNISEDKEKTLGSEFITRAMPKFTFNYQSPFWVWDVGYNFQYRYYNLNKKSNESLHNLSARTKMTLIDEKAFLEISDVYSRVSLDQARDTTQESLFSNQSDQNTFTVSPNFVLRPTTKLTLRPGASYQNIWYKNPNGVGRDIYSGFLNSEYALTDKLSLTSSYVFTMTDAEGNISRTNNLMAGMKYEYLKGSVISIQGGNSWHNALHKTSSNPVWNVAINYASDRYNLKIGAGEAYTNDPTSNRVTLNTTYNAGFDWIFSKGKLGLTSSLIDVETFPGNFKYSVSYNNAVSLKYEILPDWEANITYTYNYIDIRHSNTYTTLSQISPSISYSYREGTKALLRYSYLHMYSPDIPVDNKDINTVALEISVAF